MTAGRKYHALTSFEIEDVWPSRGLQVPCTGSRRETNPGHVGQRASD